MSDEKEKDSNATGSSKITKEGFLNRLLCKYEVEGSKPGFSVYTLVGNAATMIGAVFGAHAIRKAAAPNFKSLLEKGGKEVVPSFKQIKTKLFRRSGGRDATSTDTNEGGER